MTDRYIVKTASAQMPSSCFGRYGKVALIETDGEAEPKMISERARHLVRIVELRDRLHIGGPKSAFQLALAELQATAAELNHLHLSQLAQAAEQAKPKAKRQRKPARKEAA